MTDRALRLSLIGFAAAGAAIAAYLTALHYRGGAPICVTSGCETVQHSQYATLVGLPVSALGLAMFVALLASAFVQTPAAVAGATVVGGAAAVFAAYLVVVQLAVLHAVCIWCIAADSLTPVVAMFAALRLRQLE